MLHGTLALQLPFGLVLHTQVDSRALNEAGSEYGTAQGRWKGTIKGVDEILINNINNIPASMSNTYFWGDLEQVDMDFIGAL